MKKFITGVVLSFSLWTVTPTAHAFSFGDFVGGLNQVGQAVSGVANVVSGVRGIIGGITGDIRGIGGNIRGIGNDITGGGSSVRYSVNNTGFNSGSSVVIMQDFDSIFDQVNTGTGVTPTGRFELPDPEKFNTIGQNTSLRQYILNVLNFTLTFLGLIAVAMVIYAGYLYVASAGEDSNIEKSKKILIYAVIGILVVLASFAIVNTVIKNAGVGTDDRNDISNDGGTNSNNTNLIGNNSNGDITGLITGNGSNLQTVVNPDGTVSVVNVGDNSGTGSVTQNLASVLLLSGEGVNDFGGTVMASPDAARNGITFGLSTQAVVVIDFGDRTQSVLDTTIDPTATITHQFGEEKSYNIRGVVQTSDGQQFTTQKTLTVGGTDAQFSASKSQLLVDEKVALDGGSSTVLVGSIKSYKWTCAANAGGGCFEEAFGKNVEVSFSESGEYEITLEIENVVGDSDTFTKTFTVLGNQPVAEFTFDSTGNTLKPAEIRFNGNLSKNISGINQGLTYFWSFDGDFQQASSPEMTYEFDSVGDKSVELVVVESRNGSFLRSEPYTLTVPITTTIPIDFEIN